MTSTFKNKTLACLLAIILGAIGAHRVYLHGWRDHWAWLHVAAAVLTLLLLFGGSAGEFAYLPLVLSALVGMLMALVIGLTPDEKWDAAHNSQHPRRTESRWPLAVLLVLAMMLGATGLIAVMARSFDLLYTGGSYG